MYKKLCFLLACIPSIAWGQIAPAVMIDTSFGTAGVSQMAMSDLDNDGDEELIVSFTGTQGKLGSYDNTGGGTFSTFQLIDSISQCKGVATGDFDNNGWDDLVAIGGIHHQAWIYMNNMGIYGPAIPLDSNISIMLNDVVVADFDMNNTADIVIIGQHSIDLYRNNGTGNFTKEIILTTGSSPKPLECLDLAIADVDMDGDTDLVCGETAGLVVYFNSGNAIFTPQYYSVTPEIVFLVHPFDVDQDNDPDIVIRNSANDVSWYRNDGSGNMIFMSVLASIPKLSDIKSIDYNNDGMEDIYASYPFHIAVFLNDITHSFNTEIPVYQDSSLIMGVIHIGNVDNQNMKDYIWSGGNNTIACHLNQNPVTSVRQVVEKTPTSFFPNPTTGMVNLRNAAPGSLLNVYNAEGRLIKTSVDTDKIDLSDFPDGSYYLLIKNEAHTNKTSYKILKNTLH